MLDDALIIRSLLVPAIMHRIGPANWAMPVWLDRIVPHLSIEADYDPDDIPHGDDHACRNADRRVTVGMTASTGFEVDRYTTTERLARRSCTIAVGGD